MRNKRTKAVLSNKMHKIKSGNADNRERNILKKWNKYVGEHFYGERGKSIIRKISGRTERIKI